MKLLIGIMIVLTVLVLGLFALVYGEASADRRAKFIATKASLMEADIELHKFGAFTNHFQDMSVYPYTNRFTIDGTDYQCEFAVECADFTNQGFLTITTNRIFVWVDKRRGLMPLVTPRIFPPGF